MLSYVLDEGTTASTTIMETWFHFDMKINRHTVRNLVPMHNNQQPAFFYRNNPYLFFISPDTASQTTLSDTYAILYPWLSIKPRWGKSNSP